MEKKYDVVALGEFLIDFTPAGSTDSGMKLFEQNPGGAPVNMLTAVSKAGLKTAFIERSGMTCMAISLLRRQSRQG